MDDCAGNGSHSSTYIAVAALLALRDRSNGGPGGVRWLAVRSVINGYRALYTPGPGNYSQVRTIKKCNNKGGAPLLDAPTFVRCKQR